MPSSITPEQALEKVLKISRRNGGSVVVFAGLCTFLTVLLGDWTGVFVGSLVVASGIMELQGNRMLRRGEADGMRWLIRAQFFLLSVIFVYAVTRLVSYSRELGMESFSPDMRDVLKQLDLKPDDILPLVRKIVWAFYGSVILATGLYQGGLAFFYNRRKAFVEQALAVPAAPENDD